MRFAILILALSAGIALCADTKSKLPEGPGAATTLRLCGTCHAAEIVMSRRESAEGWSGVIEDMVARGLKGSDEEYGEVVDYLVAHYSKTAPLPKINVNKADAADLVAGLGVPNPQAAAIVKYREQNGGFKAFEDLLKVPGINARSLESKKNRIEF